MDEDNVIKKNSNTFDATLEVSWLKSKKNHRAWSYLPQWKKEPEAFY